MALINFQYTKIEASKKKADLKGYKTKQGFSLKKVEFLPVGKERSVAKIAFEMKVEYEPKIASIKLEGEAVFSEGEDAMKQIKESFEKNKKFPAQWGMHVMNVMLMKCNIKILTIAQDLNIPPHIQLPIYQPKTKEASDYIG